MNPPRVRRRTDLRPTLSAMLAVAGLAFPLGAIAAGRISAIEQGRNPTHLGELDSAQAPG